MDNRNFFFTVLEAGNETLGASMIWFWWGPSSRLQRDLSSSYLREGRVLWDPPFLKKVKHFIFLSLSSERQRERMHTNTRPCTSRWGAEWEAETRRGKENPKQSPHCKRRALWEAGAHESVSKVTTWAQTKSQTLSHPGAPLWDPFYKGTNPIRKGWPFKT